MRSTHSFQLVCVGVVLVGGTTYEYCIFFSLLALQTGILLRLFAYNYQVTGTGRIDLPYGIPNLSMSYTLLGTAWCLDF